MRTPGRAAAGALFAALAVFAAACSRPPKGMRRLDSGDLNHGFRIDQRRRHLFYVEGGGDRATRLGVVNLENGRRRSYRFSPEHIVALQPSFHEDAVAVAVEASRASGYELLKVEAESGRVLLRKPSETLTEKDFVNFGEHAPLDDDDRTPSSELTPSGPTAPEANDEPETMGVRPIGGVRPGIRATTARAGRRSVVFFGTETAPKNMILAPDGKVYASSRGEGKWKIEEFDASNGKRRTVASFTGEVESMAYVGHGLVLLRRGDGGSGPRILAMVDAAAGRVALELPWSDGVSEILDADTDKRLLYIRMNEGESQTCWSVHFDETALRDASAYLAAARAPNVRKLTDTDVLGLVVIGGMLVLLIAIPAVARN